jgi:hypothetical protein
VAREFQKVPAGTRPIVFSFNPWVVGNADTLIQSFLVQLAAAVGVGDNVADGQKAAKELLSYSSIFTALKFIPGAEPWATIVREVVDAVGHSAEKISELKKVDIEHRRAKVVKAIKNLRRRIVVLVDDLDRLPPADVFAMIRLVKAVGDFPGVVYVLCFEPGYVVDALRKHDIEYANQYLDKVIQTRLTVPKISRDDLVSILNREFEALPKEANKDYFPKVDERHNELYFAGLGWLLETPRDIKRLFNRIRFVEPGCRGEVNLADLIALEAIAIKAPTVYQHIRDNPAAYIGREPGVINLKEPKELIENLEVARKLALEKAPERLRGYVQGVLEELFPLLVKNGFATSVEHAKIRGLVCAEDRLAIALAAGLPSGEVSYAKAVTFLNAPETRADVMVEVLETGRLRRFVEHLRFAQKGGEVVDPSNLANVIGRALDTPAGAAAENEPRDVIGAGVCRNAWWLIESCIEHLAPGERSAAMENIVLDSTGLTLGAYAISHLQGQHGAFPDTAALPAAQRWLPTEALSSLTKRWSELVAAALRDGRAYAATQSGMLLYRLKRFQPEVFAAILPDLIGTEAGFDRFALAIGHIGTDSTHGRYAQFGDDDLRDFGGALALKKRAKKRLEDLSVSGELRFILRAIVSGKKTYLVDGLESDDN